MKTDKMDFDKHNRELLREFINNAEQHDSELSGTVISTIAQFVINMGIAIRIYDGDWITIVDIVEIQIEELRNCIINLNAYKEQLINGMTKQ